MKRKVWLLFLTLALCVQFARSGRGYKSRERERKAKFLFNVVRFKNQGCTSSPISATVGARQGTCYTSSECADAGGTASGTCASSFGVCCVFFVTGGNVNQNCSYIRSEGFPGNFGGNMAQYTIQKCSPSVCDIRLDFLAFTTLGPADTQETNGGECQDTLMIASAAGKPYPTICGENTGQHAIIDIGARADDTATLNFAFVMAMNANRNWEIKVTQIECDNKGRPPKDCFQYFTGTSGTFKTFNFDNTMVMQNLANQEYQACIRQEVGYCCVEYKVCADAMSFSISSEGVNKGRTDGNCNAPSADHLVINGLSSSCGGCETGAPNVSKICGNVFYPALTGDGKATDAVLCDCQEPFNIGVFTDDRNDNGNAAPTQPGQSRGVCLNWRLLPCRN